MNRTRIVVAALALVLFLISPGCGKKGPPTLPKQNLSFVTSHWSFVIDC